MKIALTILLVAAGCIGVYVWWQRRRLPSNFNTFSEEQRRDYLTALVRADQARRTGPSLE